MADLTSSPSKNDQNQEILERLPQLSCGTSKFGQTYGIVENKYQDTTSWNFRFKGVAILELNKVQGQPTKKSLNQELERYANLKLTYLLIGR